MSSTIFANECEQLYNANKYKSAMTECKKTAKLEDPKSLQILGLMYYLGNGTTQSYGKALDFFEHSARLGNSRSNFALGLMYYQGTGIEQNYNRALYYFKKAKELGDIDALVALSIMYDKGNGVEQDSIRAKQYLEEAAKLGNDMAIRSLQQESVSKSRSDSDPKSNVDTELGLYLLLFGFFLFTLFAYLITSYISQRNKRRYQEQLALLYANTQIMTISKNFIIKHSNIYLNLLNLVELNDLHVREKEFKNMLLSTSNTNNYSYVKKKYNNIPKYHYEEELTLFIRLINSIIPSENVIHNIRYTALVILNKASIVELSSMFEKSVVQTSLSELSIVGNRTENRARRLKIFESVISEYLEVNSIGNMHNYYIGFLLNKSLITNSEFFEYYDILNNTLNSYIERLKLNEFHNSLLSEPQPNTIIDFNSINNSLISKPIDSIDLMNGYEFEDYIGKLFLKLNYTITKTPLSGDKGVDIIAKKNDITLAIQTKRYSSKVGNSAVQEVVAGAIYHKCNQKLIVTNNYFTKSAYELAIANDVVLWDRDRLMEEISSSD